MAVARDRERYREMLVEGHKLPVTSRVSSEDLIYSKATVVNNTMLYP